MRHFYFIFIIQYILHYKTRNKIPDTLFLSFFSYYKYNKKLVKYVGQSFCLYLSIFQVGGQSIPSQEDKWRKAFYCPLSKKAFSLLDEIKNSDSLPLDNRS